MIRLETLNFEALNVPLHEPFGIATGAQHLAENVLVRLELEDGTIGLGEAAPVPHISGESQAQALEALGRVEAILEGRDLADYRLVCEALGDAIGHVPSALAGVEMALFDALARHHGVSLVSFFGGAESTLEIDVTITTGSVDHARRSASRFHSAGFEALKVKIGGVDPSEDVARLHAIAEAAPGARLLLDGNTAFSATSALRLLDDLGETRSRIALFEQPTPARDLDGLREVEQKSGILVAADESLRSREDFRSIIRTGGISVLNIKTAKLGVLAAWDILVAARTAGLSLMMGGMVETEISMTTSACLAAGVGGVTFVDLDTPLFLGPRPTAGRVSPWGPRLDLKPIETGHGVSVSLDEEA